jgi:hypothetical protein
MESLDYRTHTIHVNPHTAKVNKKGEVTIVVAARDPGYGNWVETAGHDHGTMLLRWTGAEEHPIPTCRVIKNNGKAVKKSAKRASAKTRAK